VYVSVAGGYRWTQNRDHVEGFDRDDAIGTVELRLNR
jgi:hypothetical protein